MIKVIVFLSFITFSTDTTKVKYNQETGLVEMTPAVANECLACLVERDSLLVRERYYQKLDKVNENIIAKKDKEIIKANKKVKRTRNVSIIVILLTVIANLVW